MLSLVFGKRKGKHMTIRIILAAVAGAIIGYLVGTAGSKTGGTCPFLCNPRGAMIFFAVLAVLLTSMFKGGSSGAPADFKHSAVLVEVGDAEAFARLLAESRLVLVDFYADWCPPCRALKPTIHALADEYQGRAVVAAVNVDKVGGLAKQYGVSGIPDVRIFQDGVQKMQLIGRQDAAKYRAELDKLLTTPAN